MANGWASSRRQAIIWNSEYILNWHIYASLDLVEWIGNYDRRHFIISVFGASCWDHFLYAPSQWETTLQCNVVSHWLDSHTKWSLGRVTLSHFSNHHIYTSLVASLRHANIYFQGAKQVIWKTKLPSVVFVKMCRLYLMNKVEAEWHIYASII